MDAYYPDGAAADAEPNIRFPVDNVVRFDTMYVETGRFLRADDDATLQVAGGTDRGPRFRDRRRRLQPCRKSWCSTAPGSGARSLFGDERADSRCAASWRSCMPQPEVRYAFAGGSGYMFPRADGIMLGGTFERGRLGPDTATRGHRPHRPSHQRFFDGFRCTA